MDIGRFIDDFVKLKDDVAKDRLVRKHIIKDYLDYATKIDESKKIIKFSLYNNDGKFFLNSPIHYMLFTMSVIKNYTDLEFDQSNIMVQFDLVMKYGLMKYIISAVSADYEMFSAVLRMVYDDEFTNQRSIIPYIEQKFEAIMAMIDAMNEVEEKNGQ